MRFQPPLSPTDKSEFHYTSRSIKNYINLLNLTKSFDSGLRQYMRKAARPLGGMDSSNPRRWRGKQFHHHGGDVRCVFVLHVAVTLVVCKKVPEQNLNSLSAKSVLAGEKLVATYSTFYIGIVRNILRESKTRRAKIYLPTQRTNWRIPYDIN
jgi:hypothetical protein